MMSGSDRVSGASRIKKNQVLRVYISLQIIKSNDDLRLKFVPLVLFCFSGDDELFES